MSAAVQLTKDLVRYNTINPPGDERLCAQQDKTPSQVVRQLIRDYLTHHGVSYLPSGASAEAAAPKSRSRR